MASAAVYTAGSISGSDSERDSCPLPLSSNSLYSSSSDTQTETESPPETPSRVPPVVAHAFKQTRPNAALAHSDPFALYDDDAKHHTGYESEMEDLQATPEKKDRGRDSHIVRWWMQPAFTGAKLRDRSLPRSSLHGSPRQNGSPRLPLSPRLPVSPQQPRPASASTTPVLESTPRPSQGQRTPVPNRPSSLSTSASIIRGTRPANLDLSSIPPYRSQKQWLNNQVAVGLGLGIPSSRQKLAHKGEDNATEPSTSPPVSTIQSPSRSPGRMATQRSASAPNTPSVGFIPRAPLLHCAPFPPSLDALRPLDPSPLYSPSPLDLPPSRYRRRHARIVSQPTTSSAKMTPQMGPDNHRIIAAISTPTRRPGLRNARLRLSVNVIHNLASTALHSPVPRTLKGSAPRMVSLDTPPLSLRQRRATPGRILGIVSPQFGTPLSHRPSVLSPLSMHQGSAFRPMFIPASTSPPRTPWAEAELKLRSTGVETAQESMSGVESGWRSFNPYFAAVEPIEGDEEEKSVLG